MEHSMECLSEEPDGMCRLCWSPAVVRVVLTEGCLARPNDRTQDLCIHHYHRCSPIGELSEPTILDQRTWDWYTKTEKGMWKQGSP